jgi:ParB family transcriptional regulator, chromosome partitioning protein
MRSHLQPRPRDPRTIPGAVATALPSPTRETGIHWIELDQLTVASAGRRKIGHESIARLAERIHATGKLQSLIVVPAEDFGYHVVAGERRLAALQLLADQGRIAPRYPVPCRVMKAKAASGAGAFTEFRSAADHLETAERRRRFIDLLNQCPGLVTGSELAARECLT